MRHPTKTDLAMASRTKRYADGRQKLLLTHVGSPGKRLPPAPSLKAKQRQGYVSPQEQYGPAWLKRLLAQMRSRRRSSRKSERWANSLGTTK